MTLGQAFEALLRAAVDVEEHPEKYTAEQIAKVRLAIGPRYKAGQEKKEKS
jgi:hypothetical protein